LLQFLDKMQLPLGKISQEWICINEIDNKNMKAK